MWNRIEALRRGLLFIAALACGCATVSNGPSERVPVLSDPPGAMVTVDCGEGERPSGITPATVVLNPRAPVCTLHIARDGYGVQTVELRRQTSFISSVNLLAVMAMMFGLIPGEPDPDSEWLHALSRVLLATKGGRVALGIGITSLGIDYATGAMFRHTPREIHVQLYPADGQE
jgi:hypothetical protein